MVGNPPELKESYNISNEIFNFISNFHKKYNIKFDIELLKDNIDKEENNISNICKNFLDLVFTDGENYISSIQNEKNELGEKNNDENVIKEINEVNIIEEDNFVREKDNLIEKLHKLSLNDDINVKSFNI